MTDQHGIFRHRNLAKEAKCTYYYTDTPCKEHGSRFKWTDSNYYMCCKPALIQPHTHARKFNPKLKDVVTDLRG